jgi:hypothetical protein
MSISRRSVRLCVCLSAGAFLSAGDKINRLNYLTLIFPILNMAAIWTNDFHHLYFRNFSLVNSELLSGPLHNLQSLYAYRSY